MATATKPPATLAGESREQVAARLTEMLTDDPLSAAALARQLGIRNNQTVNDALGVLEARQQAKRIPNTAGSRQGGWVRFDSSHERRIAQAIETHWPYIPAMVSVDLMFVDMDYQRPLTSFVATIEKNFDPVLFQPVSLSDRGKKLKTRRFALMDGQTRWTAGRRIGITECPANVYENLSPEEEADIFWRLQKFRRGMVSGHVFKAKVRSKDPQALAVLALVKSAGFEIGDGKGQLKAVGALESCFKRDQFELGRALALMREAWPEAAPEGSLIRGLHYFLLNYPLAKKTRADVDDDRLVRRLKVAGVGGIEDRTAAARRLAGHKSGNTERFYAQAIEASYLSGGRG